VVLGVALLVFLLLHLVPGDPVELMLGDSARPADREALRHALGLDRPLSVQLLNWFSGLARLDLGESLFSHRPVVEILGERLPATLELAAAALGLGLTIALPLGVMAGRIRLAGPERPLTGVHPSHRENSRINSGPSQKLGMETPNREKLMAAVSAGRSR